MNEVDTTKVLESVKPLIGVNDELQDNVLTILIDDSKANILSFINMYKAPADYIIDYPQSIEWVLRGVVIKQYNRLGEEGKKSTSEEGSSSTWDDSLLDEYIHALEPLAAKKAGNGITRFF